METKLNLGFSFPGNVAFGGKSLQFRGKIYHLDGYFGISVFFLQRNFEDFFTIFQGNIAFVQL